MTQHRWSTTCPAPAGLVRPVRVDPAGVHGPTPDQAKGPHWRRTSWGFHVPADVDGDRPEQRIVEQAARLPAGGAVTGWAALRLHGGSFFDGLDPDGTTRQPVPLAVGAAAKVRADAAASVSREPLDPAEVVVRHGVPCTRVRRALFDEMRRVPDWRESVVAMDMAAAADLVSVRQMGAYAEEHARWRRSRQVHRALPLASELSRSPNETRLRLVWVLDAGLPPPLVNCEVFTHGGRLVGVADLLDVAREEDFRRLGLEYLKVTGPDLPFRRRVVDRMLSTRARARFLPEQDRAWTLRPPPGWPAAESLDDLLGIRAAVALLHQAGGGRR